jgi:hypothetical protein
MVAEEDGRMEEIPFFRLPNFRRPLTVTLDILIVLHDHFSDELGALGHNGVSTGFNSVHPIGKPITSSAK